MAATTDGPGGSRPSSSETLRLVELFLRIADPVARHRVLAIVEALAEDCERARARLGGPPPHRGPVRTDADVLAICRRVLER